MEAIKLSLEAEQIKYNSGYSDSDTLLELQDKKLKIQQQYTSAVEKKITSVMDMLIATGDFTAQNLKNKVTISSFIGLNNKLLVNVK